MGWNSDFNSDNFNLRSSCLDNFSLAIIGTAETHLKAGDVLQLDDYKWYGNNRKNIHVRARKGSGGVGFFIRDDIANSFDVSILDNTREGVLWLKLVNKIDDTVILPCVCYLPPENSSRHVDV